MLEGTDVRRLRAVPTRLAHGTSIALIMLGRVVEALAAANHMLAYRMSGKQPVSVRYNTPSNETASAHHLLVTTIHSIAHPTM